ncbi:MAG: ATP-binding cassette, subfamily multidrug efflux pump [Clostridiales bacterium]|nr:ATP-binding cassette, subfamily multidrug efflux pump [Clostridiales bacterium]MDN5281729.1 ATP-binding cassette, subfamily multidrug efflux pump [Candidatus Ozemobacter sp.]
MKIMHDDSYFSPDDLKAPHWDTGLVRRIMPYLARWRGHFLLSILLVLAGTAVQISLPYLLGKAVDQGLKQNNHEALLHYVLLYGSGHFMFFVLSAARNWLLQYTGQKVLHDLRNSLFNHLQKLPISFFDHTPTGRLVTRVTNDVATLAELFSAALVNVSGQILVLIGTAAMMMGLHFKLGAAALITSPILFAAAWFLKVRMREAFRLARAKLAMLNAVLAENISGMNVIQIYNQEAEREKKFDVMNTDLKKAELDSVFYNSFFFPAVTIVNALTMAIIIIYGGWLVQQSSISIGLLVAFIAYTQAFYDPVRQISEKVSIFQSSMASAERVFSLMDESPEPDLDEGKEFSSFEKAIEFSNFSFSYSPDKPIIKNLNLKIEKGQRIAIVGHTGAGKTTLASLLKRFYEYSQGQLSLDSVDLKAYSRSSIRRKIALIQQDVTIFSGNIKDNIFLEEGSYDEDKMQKIIAELEMQTLLDRLPNGLETEIFERGSNLSAGQRQLIAFCRALATDPEILILDEATSSVDSETESIIQRAVLRLTSNRTSLIIAHRLSTIQNCDRIIVLHNGRLVEEGTHEELLAAEGHYHKLYELQFSQSN